MGWLFCFGLIAAGCGASNPATSSATHSAGTASSPVAAAPPAAPVVPLTKLPIPAPFGLIPEDRVGAALGGPSNGAAARALADALRAGGVDTAFIGIDVLSLRKNDQGLAIFSIDMTKAGASPDDALANLGRIFRSLAAAPAVTDANITRIAANIRTRDPSGVYLLTLTMPISVVDAIGKGKATLSQADYSKQVVYDLKRVSQ